MDIRKALAVFCILAVIGIVGYVVYDSFRTVDEFSPVVTIECGEMILDEPYTIDPAKVYVERIRPGHQVNCPLTIKNTGAENCTYILSIVTPRPPQEGYEAYNLNTPVWAVLSAREMTVAPGETNEATLSIGMPHECAPEAGKIEVWVRVQRYSEDNVKTDMVSRWLISLEETSS